MTMRKSIPLGAKFLVLLRQANCAECKEPLGNAEVEFDHRPALWEREYDAVLGDYNPPQNDPTFLRALHLDCHKRISHGTCATTAGSDSNRRAKMQRINRVWEAHKECIRTKGEAREPVQSRWPKRKFGQ